MVQSKLLNTYPNLMHGFGEKNETWEKFGIPPSRVASVSQIHSNRIVFVTKPMSQTIRADGMVTNQPLYLVITTADCVPLLLYTPSSKYIAAIHAGWKGIINGIVENAIKILKSCGNDPAEITAAIGPHIRGCCYNVERERAEVFRKRFHESADLVRLFKANWHLDIGNAVHRILISCGVRGDRIDNLRQCTSCDRRFNSTRRDGVKTPRAINVIGISDSDKHRYKKYCTFRPL